MWSSRLFWKIFFVYTGLTVTTAAAFLFYVSVWQTNLVREQLQHQFYDLAVLLCSRVAAPLQPDSTEPMQVLVTQLAELTETRMTLINVNGTVLADSDKNPSQMQNHKNLPELLQAAETGVGQSERRSPTLGIHMFYLALPIESVGKIVGFVRVAMDVRSIHQQVWSIRRLLWLMTLVAGPAALGLTYTIVILTRNMHQAVHVSHQTAFLFHGKLIEMGSTSGIFTRPTEKQTEDYVTRKFG